MVQSHNVISVRLRLTADTLEHYCLVCPTVRQLLPQDQPLDVVCQQLLNHNVLEKQLLRYPRFGGFK